MSTEIGQLRLSLPAGFEKRAGHIGRLVGRALAQRNLPAGRFPQVTVGPLRIDARGSNHAIANHLAEQIHAVIARQSHGL
jgi:hypothetical protein